MGRRSRARFNKRAICFNFQPKGVAYGEKLGRSVRWLQEVTKKLQNCYNLVTHCETFNKGQGQFVQDAHFRKKFFLIFVQYFT